MRGGAVRVPRVQGSPIDWVTTHHAHHALTDVEGDPHDANAASAGRISCGWRFRTRTSCTAPSGGATPRTSSTTRSTFSRPLPDWLTLLLAAVLFALGGVSWVVRGVFVRLVLVYQFTWLVNSAAHTTGYRSFRTPDRSTNCWWVALLGWGEGWHDNHHAFPFSVRHGLRWYSST